MERRLTTILAADVAGYSVLMEDDEGGTLDELKHRRSDLIDPLLRKFDGRMIKDIGDGFLAEFASVVNAVHFAADLQTASQERNGLLDEGRRMRYRIGINLSDVIADANDVYGEGVNVASRLEGLAEPGGICISDTVYQHVRRHMSLAFEDIGKRHLKNISGEVQVYRVAASGPAHASRRRSARSHQASIAVLPFNNMSGDPAQDYFSDGITEDIITDLSKVSSLFVVARNTAFTLKGSHVAVGAVAERLGVQYVLEGSVRSSGNRVRITAQLIDGRSGGHLWADRYDREMKDIFALQDEISRAIVTVLRVKLLPSEAETLAQRSTGHPDAYRYYLIGRSFFNRSHTRRTLRLARQMFQKALDIDPAFARALAGMADSNSLLLDAGDISVSCDEIIDQSERALASDPSLAEAHASRGLALYTAGRYVEAEASFESALARQPDLFEARLFAGRNSFVQKRYSEAIDSFRIAAEINQSDFRGLGLQAMCYQSLGRREEALATARLALTRAERAVSERPDDADALSFGAGLLAFLGEADRTRDWAERAAIIEPDDIYLQYNLACAYAVLGDTGRALDRLEEAMSKMPLKSLVEYMQSDSDLDVLRDSPRYTALLSRILKREQAGG